MGLEWFSPFSTHFSPFSTHLSASPKGQGQTTAIYCKNGEFHSDPVCTDPVQNFPRNFEKGLAERGGWREEILPTPEIQASLLHPFSYSSFRRFWGTILLHLGLCQAPTPSLQPLLETSELYGKIFMRLTKLGAYTLNFQTKSVKNSSWKIGLLPGWLEPFEGRHHFLRTSQPLGKSRDCPKGAFLAWLALLGRAPVCWAPRGPLDSSIIALLEWSSVSFHVDDHLKNI